MRIVALILILALVGACGSDVLRYDAQAMAVVGVPVDEGCENPSVNIVGIVSIDSGKAIATQNVAGPMYVSPGSYEVFVVCPNPLDETGEKCVPLKFKDQKPTFKVLLEAGERYAFSCYLEDGAPLYRLADYGY